MPRKPKPKNTLTAGERVALFEAEREKRQRQLSGEDAEKKEPLNAEKRVEFLSVAEKKQPDEKKKSLPKPQHATVTVDFSLPVGEIKPLHGMCNGPVSYGADISGLFRDIGVPFVRFDCTDTGMSAYAVDISRIFKNFDADPSLPENYDFFVTDKYVEAAYMAGARVIFRLGESGDLLFGKKIDFPTDYTKLARICANIIRHYNYKWANGFEFGIEYFEIWNHDRAAVGEEFKREFELYSFLANSIKLVDEEIRVGGMCFEDDNQLVREFLRSCKKNNTPLDFVTVACMDSNPENAAQKIEKLIEYAKNLGSCPEFIVGKWSYVSADSMDVDLLPGMLLRVDQCAAECRKKLFEAQKSVQGAAYAAALLLRLSKIPEITTACFFDAQPMVSPWCAICDRFENPMKPYYAVKAFGDLYRTKHAVFCDSLQTVGMAHTGIYANAAVSEKGEGYVMIASFEGCGVVDLRLDGISDNLFSAEIYLLDGVKDLACVGDQVPLSGMKKRLLLNMAEYGVAVIRLK